MDKDKSELRHLKRLLREALWALAEETSDTCRNCVDNHPVRHSLSCRIKEALGEQGPSECDECFCPVDAGEVLCRPCVEHFRVVEAAIDEAALRE